jgi:hypothetical protein
LELERANGKRPQYGRPKVKLYVRALVVSDAKHPKPTVPGDVMKAWTQPVVLRR